MPNEIYHRSEWGNPKAEGFGDVYFDASATNKLYKHSDYYENSDGTDKILRDIPNKASIVLTPTAYSDGSLNTVIPPYQVLPQELVTNGNFANGTTGWTTGNSGVLSIVDGSLVVTGDGGSFASAKQVVTGVVGKTYKLTGKVAVVSGSYNVRVETNQPSWINLFTTSSTDFVNFVAYFVCVNTSIDLRFTIFNATTTSSDKIKIDNVSVKEIQEADFDFSRGSSATRVNEKGLIEDVQILSGNLVQNGDFEQIGSELVTNGNFENGGANWVNVGGNAVFENSTAIFENNARIYQGVVSDLSKFYKISIDVNSVANDGLLILAGNGNSFISYSVDDIINNGNKIVLYSKFVGSGNLYVYSQSANTSAVIDNVSVKEVGQNWDFVGDFETDGTKAFITSASQYSQLTNQTGVNYLLSGNKYRLTFDIPTLSISGAFAYRYTGGSVTPILTSDIQNGKFTTEFTMPSNGWFWLQTTGSYTGLNVEVDNISVIEITDDTDIPRIDYTSGQGALLLEPQRTNLLTYSENFSSWSRSGTITQTDNYGISPEGKRNSTRLQLSNNAIIYRELIPPYDGARSLYVKATSGSGTIQLLSHNTNTDNIFTIDENWQRVELSNVQFINQNFYLVDTRGGSNTTIFDIEVWGAQAEQGSYPTSYIPTEGATVTRAADVANNSGNADLFNDSEGVLYAEMAALADTTSQEIAISLSEGQIGANRLLIRMKTNGVIGAVLRVANTTQASIDSGSLDQSTSHKIAVKYKLNDIALWIDGIEVGTDNLANVFPANTLDEVSFNQGNNSNNFYGNVKALAVFKEALTDAELESLTSWISFVEMATDLEYTLE